MTYKIQPYQYTTSIGFRLDGDIDKLLPKKIGNEAEELYKLQTTFLEQYQQLLDIFSDAVFFEGKDGVLRVSKFLQVKYPFLRQHAKEYYYAQKITKRSPKLYTSDQYPFLHDVFLRWHKRNVELYEKLQTLIQLAEHAQQRRADILLFIKKWYSADNAFFVRDFVQYANHKKESKALNQLQQNIENIFALTGQLLTAMAPNQEQGAEIARASFNYYTVNKTSRDFEKEKKTVENKKTRPFVLSYEEKKLLKRVGFTGDINSGIADLYDVLKDFKAQQKSAFMQGFTKHPWLNEKNDAANHTFATQKNITLDERKIEQTKGKRFNGFAELGKAFGLQPPKPTLSYTPEQEQKRFVQWVRREFILFDAKEDVLKNFLVITKKIAQLGDQKNQAQQRKDYKQEKALGERLRKLRMKRGNFFRNEKYGFENYVSYCNIFKKVAMQYGKIKARLRAIEQDEVEARLLQYWALFVDKEDRKQLLLVPKEYRAKVRKQLHPSMAGNMIVLEYNSLTLRALDKLVRKNYPREIPKMNKDEQYAISVYKQMLSGKRPEIKLDTSSYRNALQSVINKDFSSKDKFRRALEQVAYSEQKYVISAQKLAKWQQQYGGLLFDISSYDLERDVQRVKPHTHLWHKVWSAENRSNHFSLRINPELRLFVRSALEQDDEKKHRNRFSKPQLRVQFSLTINAGTAYTQAAFVQEKDLLKQLAQFNTEVISPLVKQYNQQNSLWYYGIDRGTTELATLGVVRWSKEQYEVMTQEGVLQKFNKPVFADFPVYTIKDLSATKTVQISKDTQKKVCIADNPSYFMTSNEEIAQYFAQNTASFLDMTTAKLIKGKIITNGDTKTYLNLKRANAKRKMFTSLQMFDSDARVEYKEGKFVVKNKEGERQPYTWLCFFSDNQEEKFGTTEKVKLHNDLQTYLVALRKDPTLQAESIQQINNLRDAITANMVGIIAHLFKQYPGIINLENLQTRQHIDKHRQKNEESIARRLEWALYRKFQKQGLVPPRLKNTIFLREQMAVQQIGIIHFVPEEGSSAECPRCLHKAQSDKRKQEKWNEHQFSCTNKYCKFSTRNNPKEYTALQNSDDVAACNLANPAFLKKRRQNGKTINNKNIYLKSN